MSNSKEFKVPEEFTEATKYEYSYYIWGRNRLVRILYHPLWWLTSKAYRFYRFTKLPPEERKMKAEKWAKSFRASLHYPSVKLSDIVDREEEKAIMLNSIMYHVIRKPEIIKLNKRPPPKIFLVKGSTGVGKTFLVKGIMNEAFERGLEEGIFVKLDTIRASEIKTMWYGMSAQRIADRLSQMLSGPCILFIDEAQQFVSKASGVSERPGAGGAQSEEISITSSFLNALDQLIEKPIRAVVIFSTDRYEAILETIRRRAYPINLDEGFTENELLDLTKKLCKKYNISLNPERILDTLGQTLRAIGHGKITPDDVTKAFEKVIDKIETPRRKQFLKYLKRENP